MSAGLERSALAAMELARVVLKYTISSAAGLVSREKPGLAPSLSRGLEIAFLHVVRKEDRTTLCSWTRSPSPDGRSGSRDAEAGPGAASPHRCSAPRGSTGRLYGIASAFYPTEWGLAMTARARDALGRDLTSAPQRLR